MGLFILRLAEDGPAIKDGRVHVSGLLATTTASQLKITFMVKAEGNFQNLKKQVYPVLKPKSPILGTCLFFV